jgi:hypothetical protein
MIHAATRNPMAHGPALQMRVNRAMLARIMSRALARI